jgi:hypothetical protein
VFRKKGANVKLVEFGSIGIATNTMNYNFPTKTLARAH